MTHSRGISKGLRAYIERAGFSDPALFNCTVALEMRYEALLECMALKYRLYGYFLRFARLFVSEMWAAARALEPDEIRNLLADDSQMNIWTKVIKIFWMSWR